MNKFCFERPFKLRCLVIGVFFVVACPLFAADPPPGGVEEQLKRLNEAIKATSGGGQSPSSSLPPKSAEMNNALPRPSASLGVGTEMDGMPPSAGGMGQAQVRVPTGTTAQRQVQAQNQPRAAVSTPPVNISQEAFLGTTTNLLPMSPDQIRSLHVLFDETQRAASENPGIPPLPTSSAVKVDLAPGSAPPIIRLSAGIVSSLVFVDSTGAPWPIKAYSIGNPKTFDVKWEPNSHLLLVQSLAKFKTGNIAVLLKGFDTPVMITLVAGQSAVDYRVDLRLPFFGPNAKPIIEGLPGTESPYLLDVLNGIPPLGGRRLVLSGCINCALWKLKKRYYLRTQFTLLSPAWISKVSSPDGTNAYELRPAPVLLLSEHGKVFTLKVTGL